MRTADLKPRAAVRSSLQILFLVPFAPRLDATHGGGRVTAQLITHLARRHRIALCYLRTAGERCVDERLQEQCELIEEAIVPEVGESVVDHWMHRWRVWKELLCGKPLWAIDRSAPAYSEQLRRIVNSWCPDIVQIEFHVMGQYLSALDGCSAPRILVQHEPGTEAVRQVWRSPQIHGRIMPLLNLIAWHRFERRIMQQVQTVVVFTERDRGTLLKLGLQTPIVRIPLGGEIPRSPLNSTEAGRFNLLFVGNFQHPPNVDAAVRLMDNIFPKVQARFPEARLYIVGRDPPARLNQMVNGKVAVTGRVEDIAPYLNAATVIAVPLRLGGGMRVKVLDALAAGKAVVASPLAVEGIDLVNGEHVILAESDEDFGNAIIRLLSAPEERAALGGRARIWARENLSWDRVVNEYEALYEGLLEDGRHG